MSIDGATAEAVLLELVSTPSVSGHEQAAVEVFVRHADRLGLRAWIDEVGNAVAERGDACSPVQVLLLGHIDTVPGEIPVRVEAGVLHGRGSVDAKGPLATMLIAAASAVLPEGVRVTVVGAVGEETPASPGARHLAGLHRPAACIVGEPSGWDGVTLGYKGRLIVDAACERSGSHSAGPAGSACDAILGWWAEVCRDADAMNAGRERMFERVQAGVRSITSDDDGLRQRAVLRAGFRLPPGVDPWSMEQRVRELCGLHGVHAAFSGHERAVASDRADAAARAVSAGIRAEGGRPRPKHKTGTADFNVVAPVWRCPIVAYGPGDSSLDHTPVEQMCLEEFAASVRVLTRAIELLASELVEDRSAQAAGSSMDHAS